MVFVSGVKGDSLCRNSLVVTDIQQPLKIIVLRFTLNATLGLMLRCISNAVQFLLAYARKFYAHK